MHFSTIVGRGVDGHGACRRGSDLHDPGRSSLRLRFVVRRKDGTTFPTEVSAVGIFEDGEFKGAQGTVRDVSERERLERIVHESEERYRSLVQSSPDLIFEMDGRGVYTFYSDRTEDVIGWLPDELIGRPFTEFIDIEAFPQARRAAGRDRGQPGRPSTDRLLDPPQGRAQDPVRGQRRRPGRRHGAARRRSAASPATSASASASSSSCGRPRSATGSSSRTRPTSCSRADAETRFLFISDTIERLTGFRPDEVVGRDVRSTRRARRRCTSRPSAGSGSRPTRPSPQVLRLELMRKDGGAVPVEIHSVGPARRPGRLRRGPRVRARHQRARAPGARAARVRGALPLPRPVVARPRLDDRRRRPVHVRLRPVRHDPRLGAGGADRTLVQRAGAARRSGAAPSPGSVPCGAPARGAPARGSRCRAATAASSRWRSPASGWSTDGEFLGAHGAARDVSERERLERDLRRQAVELASSEERSHLARELHDSVTQALFSMTLLSR